MNKSLIRLTELMEKYDKIGSLFANCPYSVLSKVKIKDYPHGTFLLKQGCIYNSLYFVVSGKVNIYVEAENGKRLFICAYHRGQCIGEIELFRKLPYICSVEGDGDITVLEIDRETIIRWMNCDPDFNQFIITTLSRSAYELCEKLCSNALYPLKKRICNYLLQNAESGRKSIEPVRTEFLAEKMGVTQRSVNRIIKQLKEEDMVSVDRYGVVIKDYEKLREEIDA